MYLVLKVVGAALAMTMSHPHSVNLKHRTLKQQVSPWTVVSCVTAQIGNLNLKPGSPVSYGSNVNVIKGDCILTAKFSDNAMPPATETVYVDINEGSQVVVQSESGSGFDSSIELVSGPPNTILMVHEKWNTRFYRDSRFRLKGKRGHLIIGGRGTDYWYLIYDASTSDTGVAYCKFGSVSIVGSSGEYLLPAPKHVEVTGSGINGSPKSSKP